MAAIRCRRADRLQVAVLVPQEPAHIGALMSTRVVEALDASDDRTRPGAWVVPHGDSEGEVEQILHTFAMYSYM